MGVRYEQIDTWIEAAADSGRRKATATLDQTEAGAAPAEEVISSEDEDQDNKADDTNEMSMPLPIRTEQKTRAHG